MTQQKQLKQFLSDRSYHFKTDAAISPYLTMKIGGTAAFIIEAHRQEPLLELLRFLDGHDYPFILLGGGSNVIFPDGNTPLAVIINRTHHMEILPSQQLVQVDSGVMNKDFMSWTAQQGAGNLDFLAGIPGTVGGAAAVNAGAFGQSISEALVKADIFSPGCGCQNPKTVDKDYFGFRYRESIFKYGGEVILRVYLSYTPMDKKTVKEKISEKIKYRKTNHPPQNLHTVGCFFKNPIIEGEKIPAGKLLENSGFKGTQHGPLAISGDHANFIVNRGAGTFKQLTTLAENIKHTVAKNHHIQLEREAIYISPDGKKY